MTFSSKRTTASLGVFGVTRTQILRVGLPVFLLLWIPAGGNAQHAHKQKDSASVQEQQQERSLADSHSFMELFTKLEDEWTNAIQKKDRSGLDALLAPEFILRNAEDPQHPLLRNTWISQAIAGPEPQSFRHSTMAIRAFLGVAVVSFTQEEKQNMNGKDRTARFFIVDVWEVNQHHWLAAERYILPVAGSPAVNHMESRLR